MQGGSIDRSRQKFHLHFALKYGILFDADGFISSCAVVAQLDRALDSDSKGQRFESPRPHQSMKIRTFFLWEKGSDFWFYSET